MCLDDLGTCLFALSQGCGALGHSLLPMVDRVLWSGITKKRACALTNTWSTQSAVGTASRSERGGTPGSVPGTLVSRALISCFARKMGFSEPKLNSPVEGQDFIKWDHRQKDCNTNSVGFWPPSPPPWLAINWHRVTMREDFQANFIKIVSFQA